MSIASFRRDEDAQGLPFVMNQMGVLQLTAVFPLFFLIDAVIGWATTNDRSDGIGFGKIDNGSSHAPSRANK